MLLGSFGFRGIVKSRPVARQGDWRKNGMKSLE